MSNEIKEISDKIKKCLIAGYDVDIITQDELNILWNYITNLQQENQDLSRMCELYSKSLYYAELTDYKSRVEKAIEYIKKQDMSYYGAVVETKMDIILTLLQGGKDDNN